jgi:hypothetical protein
VARIINNIKYLLRSSAGHAPRMKAGHYYTLIGKPERNILLQSLDPHRKIILKWMSKK